MCACVCSSKDEPWRHTLSEIKSVSKEQTRYDPTQMKYLEYSKRQKVEKWLPVVARETKGMELLFKGHRVSGMKDCHWTVHVKTVNYMGILHANFTTIKKKCTPEHRIVDLSVHNHSFKHWPFTYNKLYHSMYQGEQIPTTTTQLKKMDSDLPLHKTTLDLSYYNCAEKDCPAD